MEGLVKRIKEQPSLFDAFCGQPGHPQALIDEFCEQGRVTHLTKDQLFRVAYTKSPRKANVVCNNDDQRVVEVTGLAFEQHAAADCSEPVSKLTELEGVGVGVATAALAWVFPKKWAVLDIHCWRTLGKFDLVASRKNARFSAEHVTEYMKIIKSLVGRLDARTPQQIDRWLYSYSRIFLGTLSPDAYKKREACK